MAVARHNGNLRPPVSESGARLESGQLGVADLTASTVANIGPGIDFYFAFGVIAVTAGVAAPLTILAAGVAVVLLAFTVAEFTKAEPSAGSFITYVETGLGARAGVATALLVAVGLHGRHGRGVHHVRRDGGDDPRPLHLLAPALGAAHAAVLTVGAIWLTARGVRLSTTAVGVAVLAQVAVMVAVCVVVLVDERGHLSTAPFSWSHLTGGLAGLSAGFPLALYMFIGWENGPALAEECRDPKRTVPRALFISIAIGAAPLRLLRLRHRHRLPLRRLVDRALLGPVPDRGRPLSRRAGRAGLDRRNRLRARTPWSRARTRQARMLFDGGRSGLLPAWLGRIRPTDEHAGERAAGHGRRRPRHHRRLVGLHLARSRITGSTNPVGLYAECSTMGTIVILFVYFLTTLSLPVFMWRRHRDSFSALRHVAIPVLGSLTLIVPFIELCKPGQPAPYRRVPVRRPRDRRGRRHDCDRCCAPSPVDRFGRRDRFGLANAVA